MNKVSVILTTYNRKYEVRRALESVLAQSTKPFEIILVDDASIDHTKEYIESFQFPLVKYYLLKEHSGAGAARNYGIKMANGTYIAFLDSDNEWYETKLEEFMKLIREDDGSWDLICSKYKQHIFFETEILPKPLLVENYKSEQEIWLHNIADASASIYRKSFLEETGGFSEELNGNIDWELLMRGQTKRNLVIKIIDKVLSENWTMHDGLSNLETPGTVLNEKLELLRRYHKEIVAQGCGEIYYSQYMSETSGMFSETEAMCKLLKACDTSAEWLQIIIDIYRNREIANKALLDRRSDFYCKMREWLRMEFSDDSIAWRLENMNVHTIAIYGAGMHGMLLFQDLRRSNIRIACFIDRNKKGMAHDKINIYAPEDRLPLVDAVVVSTYLEFEKIKQELQMRGDFKLIPLDTLIG